MASKITTTDTYEPFVIQTKFVDFELNTIPRYKSLRWDTYLLTTFEKNHRPTTNDREYRLFNFDGYYYQQLWQGFIPTTNYIDTISIRGIIKSPNGKSYVIIGTDSRVFVLKGNKCSQLLEGARFTGLRILYYSPSTHKYYGITSKQISAQNNRRIITFAEFSLNFTKSGDLPANEIDIQQQITKIVSFTESRGSTFKSFVNMVAPNMLISTSSSEKCVRVSYINRDCGWKHTLNIDDELSKPVQFDLERCFIRRLPLLTSGILLSINPANHREMLYLCSSGYHYELAILVASKTGVELNETIRVPFSSLNIVSYCIFKNPKTGIIYYWSFVDRKLSTIKPKLTQQHTVITPTSLNSGLCFMNSKYICLKPIGFLDKLASSGGNLPLTISRMINGFLKLKYDCVNWYK